MRTLVLLLFLSACGGPLSLLTGGGPNVAANVQAARTANQTVGSNITDNRRAEGQRAEVSDSRVRADNVESVTVIEGLPFWVWILLGMLIPGPTEWVKDWLLARRKK